MDDVTVMCHRVIHASPIRPTPPNTLTARGENGTRSVMYIGLKAETFLPAIRLWVKQSLVSWWAAVSTPDGQMTGSGVQGRVDEMGDE